MSLTIMLSGTLAKQPETRASRNGNKQNSYGDLYP